MAYSDNFPATRPVFMADFANGGKIDPRASYSRSTTGTYFGTAKHLSSENLLQYSSGLDGGTWVGNGLSSRTAGQTDPSGGSAGFALVEDSANSYHRIYQVVSQTNKTLTFTVYAKRNSGSRYLMLGLGYATNNYEVAVFDLSGGAPATASGSSSTYTSVSATQTPSGNGYYKCTIQATGNLASTQISIVDSGTPAPDLYGLKLYTGDGTSSLNIAFPSLTTTGATDYNATTAQIHREYAPTLQTAAINSPRFEYSATDGQSVAKGLLIEGQSQNLLAGSATIGGSYWGLANATAEQNSAVAPDGTLTATTLIENSAGGAKYAYSNNYTPAASTTYTFSAFVKPNGRNFCMIYTNLGGAGQSSMFDLGTGATSNLSGSGVNTAVQCGNGWWRLSVTITTTGTTASNFQILPASDATTFDYVGNGYSGLICWGAMLEQASFASSYIATTSSAVTRAAESLSMDLTQAGFNGGPFTIVSETEGGRGVYPQSFVLTDGTSSNQISVYRNSTAATTTTNWYLSVASDGSNQVLANIPASNTAGKLAVSLNTDDAAFTTVGNSVTTDTSVTIPSGLSQLKIGASWTGGTNHLNGHVKRLAVFGEALSDTNLISLTK